MHKIKIHRKKGFSNITNNFWFKAQLISLDSDNQLVMKPKLDYTWRSLYDSKLENIILQLEYSL